MHVLIDFGYNRCYTLSLSHYDFSNQFPSQNQERTRSTAVVRLHNASLHMPLSIHTPDYESDRNENIVECECSARNN